MDDIFKGKIVHYRCNRVKCHLFDTIRFDMGDKKSRLATWNLNYEGISEYLEKPEWPCPLVDIYVVNEDPLSNKFIVHGLQIKCVLRF